MISQRLPVIVLRLCERCERAPCGNAGDRRMAMAWRWHGVGYQYYQELYRVPVYTGYLAP